MALRWFWLHFGAGNCFAPVWAESETLSNLIKEKENDKFEQQTGSCSEDANQCRPWAAWVGDDP